jgi:hypothetical protein
MTKYIIAIAIFVSASFSASASAQETEAISNAKASAIAWLALVDAGKYSDTWQQAASRFQSAVSETSWQSAVAAVRTPLGKVNERTLKSAVFTHSLPGAPDGNYVVIQYATQFEHRASAIETVTPTQEKDGSWKVSGYFVK